MHGPLVAPEPRKRSSKRRSALGKSQVWDTGQAYFKTSSNASDLPQLDLTLSVHGRSGLERELGEWLSWVKLQKIQIPRDLGGRI